MEKDVGVEDGKSGSGREDWKEGELGGWRVSQPGSERSNVRCSSHVGVGGGYPAGAPIVMRNGVCWLAFADGPGLANKEIVKQG